jgi:hypothetical protein
VGSAGALLAADFHGQLGFCVRLPEGMDRPLVEVAEIIVLGAKEALDS